MEKQNAIIPEEPTSKLSQTFQDTSKLSQTFQDASRLSQSHQEQPHCQIPQMENPSVKDQDASRLSQSHQEQSHGQIPQMENPSVKDNDRCQNEELGKLNSIDPTEKEVKNEVINEKSSDELRIKDKFNADNESLLLSGYTVEEQYKLGYLETDLDCGSTDFIEVKDPLIVSNCLVSNREPDTAMQSESQKVPDTEIKVLQESPHDCCEATKYIKPVNKCEELEDKNVSAGKMEVENEGKLENVSKEDLSVSTSTKISSEMCIKSKEENREATDNVASDENEHLMMEDVAQQIEEEANRIAEEAKILSESAKLSSEDETMEEPDDEILVVDNGKIYILTKEISNVIEEAISIYDKAIDANEITYEEGRQGNDEAEGDVIDGKKMERKLSLMDVDEDEENELDLVGIISPPEEDKSSQEEDKCGLVESMTTSVEDESCYKAKCDQVESLETAVQQNTDVISAVLSLDREMDGGSVEENGVEEQIISATAVESLIDDVADACVDASLSSAIDASLSSTTITVSDTVINGQTNNSKKESTISKVHPVKGELQRGRKVSCKNVGSLNSEVSKKIVNKDERIRLSNGKEETKEKVGKDNSEGRVQRTKGEKESKENKVSEDSKQRVRKESLLKPNTGCAKTENKDGKSNENIRKPSPRNTKSNNINNTNESIPKNISEKLTPKESKPSRKESTSANKENVGVNKDAKLPTRGRSCDAQAVGVNKENISANKDSKAPGKSKTSDVDPSGGCEDANVNDGMDDSQRMAAKRKMEGERPAVKRTARTILQMAILCLSMPSKDAWSAVVTSGEKRSDAGPPTTTRRARDQADQRKVSAPARIQRPQQRKSQDPVKAARATNNNNNNSHTGRVGSHGGSGAGGDQLRQLEAEVAARAAEVLEARQERDNAALGLEALTVLLNHLTNNYDAFATPRLKAEVVRLNNSLTETRLSLDETVAAVGRLREEASEKKAEHNRTVEALQQTHRERLDTLKKQHSHDVELALEKQRRELSQYAEEQQVQREALSRAHKAELEQMEGEWRTKLDIEHEKHLRVVGELNAKHTKQIRELESSRMARERELEAKNERLSQERDRLVQQTKKLEESLLNDTDHRLQAVRKLCSSLSSEVDSLKTVVDMRNSEIHELRNKVVEKERLTEDLEAARLLTRTLQAKTEDLQAQMDTKAQTERQILNEHRMLIETFQRENNINKRLSLENEELQWKLRQRDEIHSMSTSMPSSTLDLMTRSPAPSPRRHTHEGGAAQSPQVTPRSPRVNVRSGKASPARCEVKRRSRLGLSPDINEEHRDRSRSGSGSSEQEMLSLESPPPSPCVKAVIEKSNSVSFILDLNDSHDESYSSLDTHTLPPSPRPRPTRTASFGAADNRPRTPLNNRRVIQNNHTNSVGKIAGVHTSSPKTEMNGKLSKDNNGKIKETNGKSINRRSGRSVSESSEYGSEISNEIERVSPTGLSWNIPVHNTPKSPSKSSTTHNQHGSSPNRGPVENKLLEDPEEDEYEESDHQFIEVVELGGGIVALSSSDGASDSELSQCDINKGDGSSSDSDSDSSDSGHGGQGTSSHGSLTRKGGPWLPKNGAGEAMIADDILVQCGGDPLNIEGSVNSRGKTSGKRITRRRLSSAPSSDSEDNNTTPIDGAAIDTGAIDGSWSEDVDVTSSSEINEIC